MCKSVSQTSDFFLITFLSLWKSGVVSGGRRVRERERQESHGSDKTDGGESELICFFDERGTPRNDVLKFEQNGF